MVSETLSLKKADGTTGDLKAMGLFFYSVRNFYTHSGRRFHILEASTFQQQSPFVAGSNNHQEEQYLVVAENGNLVEVLLRIAISTAKRRFEWLTD